MKNRIFGFDVVRAVAIVLVMIGHTLGYLYTGEFSFFLSFLSGFFGVELFFVLSGVLIGSLLIRVFRSENFTAGLRRFLVRRWLRTLPLYFAVLPVYWFGNYFIDTVKNQDVALWKYVFFVQNFFSVQPTFFGVSWSLSVEEWFYVLFPLVLFIIKKAQPSVSTKTLFGTGVGIFVFYFLLMRFLAFPNYHFTFYEGVRKIAFFRLDSIVYGILGALGFEFYRSSLRSMRHLLFIAGIALLVFNQYFIFKDHYSHLFYFNTSYYSMLGLGIVLLFPFFKELKGKENIFTHFITFISRISYSLYLVHWLVFKFLELSWFSAFPGWTKFMLFFLLSVAAAFFTYTFIEKPFLRYRDRVTSKI